MSIQNLESQVTTLLPYQQQHREWKRAIRADAACRIQDLFRGYNCWVLLLSLNNAAIERNINKTKSQVTRRVCSRIWGIQHNAVSPVRPIHVVVDSRGIRPMQQDVASVWSHALFLRRSHRCRLAFQYHPSRRVSPSRLRIFLLTSTI